MEEPKTTRCSDCKNMLEADLKCPDCLLQELEDMDDLRVRMVLEQMGRSIRQQLEEIKSRCERLGMKI